MHPDPSCSSVNNSDNDHSRNSVVWQELAMGMTKASVSAFWAGEGKMKYFIALILKVLTIVSY